LSWLVCLGVIVLRISAPELPRSFKVPLYPLTLIVFLAMSGFGLVAAALQRPLMVGGMLGGLLIAGLLMLRFGVGADRGGQVATGDARG